MTTNQAVFAVLLVFFAGDMIGAVTQARISSMFVIMAGFLLLFLTGIYPADIMTISGFSSLASVGMYFLLFNMGTSVEIHALKREWRTVVCSIIGMVIAILACVIAIPLIGKEYALASAPVVNGGIVATNTMVAACDSLGMNTAAALATFVFAVQKFVGALPASNCGLHVAKEVVNDLRKKHIEDADYSWYREIAGSKEEISEKPAFWEKHKKYYSPFVCLGIAAAMMLLADCFGKICDGWINASIWCMVLGIVCRNTGLVPPNVLRDYGKANGFFSFLALCTIIPSLAKIDWSQLPIIGFKAVILFIFVVVLTYLVFYVTPAWRIVGSKHLAIGIAMCQMIGYPGTELVATEIVNATAETQEERDAAGNKIQTAYVISGFTSVTILSVFIASILAKIMVM